MLDSSIPALEKLQVAQDVLDEVDEADDRGELPNVSAVFEDRPEDDDYRALLAALQDQLDRAVTDAFSTPFLLAAAIALAASSWRSPQGEALCAARFRFWSPRAVAAVVVPYLALGGASFEPTPVADPCLKRDRPDPGDLEAVLEQVVLSALDGAACELGVSREESCSPSGTRSARGLRRGARNSRADAAGVKEGSNGDRRAEEADALPGLVASLVPPRCRKPLAVAPARGGGAVRRAAFALEDLREPVLNGGRDRVRIRSQAVVAGHLYYGASGCSPAGCRTGLATPGRRAPAR